MHFHRSITPPSAPTGRTATTSPIWAAPLALALAVGLSACGGHSESTLAELSRATASMAAATSAIAPHPGPNQTVRPMSPQAGVAASPQGVLLGGVPGMNAYAALSFLTDQASDPAERPRLKAAIDRSATVGQVNAALDAVGARIVSMRPGHGEVALELADASRAASVQAVTQQLVASRAFTAVGGPEAVLPRPALPVTQSWVATVTPAVQDEEPDHGVDHTSPP